MTTTPPGWYDDGRGALRWWDGAQWTEHVQTPDAEGPAVVDTSVAAAPVANAPTIDQAAYGAPVADTAVSADPVDTENSAYFADPATSVPPGYPGGFPGGSAPSGAFISATEPKKSKLWILWVVLGVVLLGIVVLIAVLIPIIIGLFNAGGSASATDADQKAAVAAVNLYDEAWGTGDCDKFLEATTEDYRTDELQIPGCEEFVPASANFSSSVENYVVTVTSIERDDDEIVVTTSETYDSLYDDQGELLETPTAYDDRYVYTIVPDGGGWAIDDLEGE